MEIISICDPSSAPKSERKVIHALAAVDASRCLAFHSVAWQGVRADRQSDGEADFVILDGGKGILILEVKGGGIELDAGQWISIDGHGNRHRIKNPFAQAMASKYALLRYIQLTDPALARRVTIAHGVVFPDVTCNFSWLGPESPRQIIIDRMDLQTLPVALDRVFAHWHSNSGPTAADRGRLRAMLAPTITVRRRLRDVVADTESEILQLTGDQIRAMQGARRNRRLVVLGGAGTGKTILAVERARQLRATGSKTLLICFNRPLVDRLRQELEGSGIDVETFHTLCSRILGSAGVICRSPIDAQWWGEEAAPALIEACCQLDVGYDAILVDEAQDFERSWLDALECVLSSRDDSIFIVHGDAHQELWNRGWQAWIELRQWPTFELSINCRNSMAIANHVATVFGDPLCTLGAEGPEPSFHVLNSIEDGVSQITSLVSHLLHEGHLQPSQIVVLASSRETVSELHSMFVGDIPFGPIGSTGLVADTIHRFKGLEAPCVIVLLTSLGAATKPEHDMLKYVAYSRATSVMHVFAKRNAIR